MFLTDLPEDVILLILPLLPPKDFLSLCSVNKAFDASFRLEPSYWRNQTSNSFRIPISPLLRAEGGSRWYWLYKKLRTQTVAYAWGQDADGCLGLEGHDSVHTQTPQSTRDEHGNLRPVPLARLRYQRLPTRMTPHSYPEEMYLPSGIGVIADLQCGGWSTSILTAKGEIWSVGILDAANGRPYGEGAQVFTKLERGHEPADGHPSMETVEPIKQFSSGRRHILGLDDAGNIWSWDQIFKRAKQVEFLTPALIGGNKPTRVVAGWQNSSAFVPEQGIVYWRPPDRDQNPFPAINEKIIPKTGYHNVQNHHSSYDAAETREEAKLIGEVLTHIVLENYVVYITSTSKVFAFKLDMTEQHQPFELTTLSSTNGTILDIQGSFRNFAVFSSTGEVLTCTTAYLDNWLTALEGQSFSLEDESAQPSTAHLLFPPPLIPALQSHNVISLAFGDYHFHALHSTGHISSYGTESQSCGAFGLYSSDTSLGRLRGLVPPRRGTWRGDANLSAQGWRSPRYIWFEREKQIWAKELAKKVVQKEWDKSVEEGGLDEEQWAAVSEWVEQEARDDAPSASEGDSKLPENRGLGSYFAVGVSAAGWHSGALVLVDRDSEPANNSEEKTDPQHGRPTRHSTLPNLRLPSGKIVQGDDDEDQGQDGTRWKFGMPERFFTSADGLPG